MNRCAKGRRSPSTGTRREPRGGVSEQTEAWVHPTALIEEGVTLGRGTRVWDHAHIRRDSVLGEECIVGGKSYIAYGVRIGNRVKINAVAYICTGVTSEDGVMVSAAAVFTNDRFPRATTPDLTRLLSSEPDDKTLLTMVREGATIGARAVIGCGLEIGRFAMVGMGAVVTRSVPDFHLVVGTPARTAGYVCRCGARLLRLAGGTTAAVQRVSCAECRRAYRLRDGEVEETP